MYLVVNKLYLIHFNADEVNKKTLETVKYVYHHVIKWSPYKPKNKGPTQCLKCLWYGHGISGCQRYTASMLCAGQHLTKNCPTHSDKTNTNTNNNFKCFNCMSAKIQHNHKANDVNCPFRQKYEEARNKARSKTTTNKQSQPNASSFVAAPVPPPQHASYADSMRVQTTSIPASNSQAHTNTRQSHTSTSQSSTNTFPGGNLNANANPSSNLWTFAECSNILFNSIENLQKCKSKLEQLQVIAQLLQNACS